MPAALRFDEEAQRVRNELEEKHVQLAACESINRKLAAHIGKYDGVFVRLCVIWHCIEHSDLRTPPPIVTGNTAKRVAQFMHEFLFAHAVSFYAGTLGLSDDHDRLSAVAGFILAHKLERITNRDVARGDRTMRRLKKYDTDSIFEQLEALGWLMRVPGARPSDSPRWDVNPLVHKRYEKRGQEEAKRRDDARKMLAEVFRKAAPTSQDHTQLPINTTSVTIVATYYGRW